MMLTRGNLTSKNCHLLRQVINRTAVAAAASSASNGHWILSSRGLSTASLRSSRSQRAGNALVIARLNNDPSFHWAPTAIACVSRRCLIVLPDAAPITEASESDTERSKEPKLHIPTNLRQKVLSATDAVSLVRSGDTVSVSGFVCQGKKTIDLSSVRRSVKELTSLVSR
jgi:hypothetical protein